MEFDDKAPIYVQIMDLIKQRIASGELKVGEQLPSVRDLAGQLVVNPNTVQKAYLGLERKGYVATPRGMGTFVTGDRDVADRLRERLAHSAVESCVATLRSLGYSPDEIAALAAQAAREVQP